MANILTDVNEGIQSYYDNVYSYSSFNQMWILKYCTDFLDNFNSRFFSELSFVFQTCDFSTL